MTGSTQAPLYNQFIDLVPDRRLIFMNHGLADTNDDYNWLKQEDANHKYSMNLIRFVLAGINLEKKTILEVGCGRGGNCSYLARYTNAGHITGVDYCEGSIAFCKNTHQFDNVSFIHGDAQNLPFEDEQFDIVINIESSHCYPSLEGFMQEVFRTLKKGGDFCYADVIFSQELQSKYSISEYKFKYARLEFKKQQKNHADIIRDSGYSMLHSEEITSRVINALEKPEGNLQASMRNLTDDKDNSMEFINNLVEVISGDVLEGYRNGNVVYNYWHLKK